jgi:hypothetical protein
MIPPTRVERFIPEIPRIMIQVSVVIYLTPGIGRYSSSHSEYGKVLDSFNRWIVEAQRGDEVAVVLPLKYAVNIKGLKFGAGVAADDYQAARCREAPGNI